MGLAELIHSATNSTGMAVEEQPLKAIKAMVRSSDESVRAACHLLMDRLAKNHSQVRYLALLIIDELFTRSKLFRSLLIEEFESFLELTTGHNKQQPLPPPADRAALLKSKTLEVVEKWYEMFGPHYKQLRLGYDYLKSTLNFKFPGLRQAATRAAEERNAREARTQELLRCRLAQLTDNFAALKNDIESSMNQMEECFTVLQERLKEEADQYNVPEEELQQYGVRSLRLALEQQADVVEESQDNEAVFDILRDLFKLMSLRHIPATQEWLSLLMRVDPVDRQQRDDLLKEVINLRNAMQSLNKRCEALGIKAVKEADGEDIEWEPEERFAGASFESCESHRGDEQVTAVPTSVSADVRPEVGGSSSPAKQMNETKQQLLRAAPVLSWGSFLDNWGSEAQVPANARGVVLDNHWGRVDPDVVIPAEKLAQMQVRASYYQAAKLNIPPCSAPMRNGGLCQRRDLRKCPLHGLIVPRDEHGRPLQDRSEAASSSSSAALPTPEAVAAQALKNVRRKSQRKMDQEHNEAVLRAASNLNGFAVEDSGLGETSSKRKKSSAGISAMLTKKPTVKDRISKKLGATGGRNEALREDAMYREAFPNQW